MPVEPDATIDIGDHSTVEPVTAPPAEVAPIAPQKPEARTRKTEQDVTDAWKEAQKDGSDAIDTLVATREAQGNWAAVVGKKQPVGYGDGTEGIHDTRVVIPVERSKGKLGRSEARVVMTADGPQTITQIGFVTKGELDEDVLKRKNDGYDAEEIFDHWVKVTAEGREVHRTTANVDRFYDYDQQRDATEITLIEAGFESDFGGEHKVYPEKRIKVTFGALADAGAFTSAMRESINKTEAPHIKALREAHEASSAAHDIKKAAQGLPQR